MYAGSVFVVLEKASALCTPFITPFSTPLTISLEAVVSGPTDLFLGSCKLGKRGRDVGPDRDGVTSAGLVVDSDVAVGFRLSVFLLTFPS